MPKPLAMPSPQDGVVNLLPGQWFFGSGLLVRTLLGSCVALTLWHPERHMGGMCHFLLPKRLAPVEGPLDGRYGDEALAMMVQSLRERRTRPEDYHCHLFGGADTLPDLPASAFNVGERNVEQGWALVRRYGFRLDGANVGGKLPRRISLDLRNGELSVQHGTALPLPGDGA